MRLLADEGVEQYLVAALRSLGHEVEYVAECAPGMLDEDVLSMDRVGGAVLITNDKDFGELVFKQRAANAGVMLLRLAGVPREEKIALVMQAVVRHGGELLGAFSVISRAALRIRRHDGDVSSGENGFGRFDKQE